VGRTLSQNVFNMAEFMMSVTALEVVCKTVECAASLSQDVSNMAEFMMSGKDPSAPGQKVRLLRLCPQAPPTSGPWSLEVTQADSPYVCFVEEADSVSNIDRQGRKDGRGFGAAKVR